MKRGLLLTWIAAAFCLLVPWSALGDLLGEWGLAASATAQAETRQAELDQSQALQPAPPNRPRSPSSGLAVCSEWLNPHLPFPDSLDGASSQDPLLPAWNHLSNPPSLRAPPASSALPA